MNKLVQSNRHPQKLNRGEPIQPNQKFSLANNTDIPNQINELNLSIPTSMKIDSILRDKINALSLIGVAETQKEVVDFAIQQIVDSLPDEQLRKYNMQFDVLNESTIRKINKKNDNN